MRNLIKQLFTGIDGETFDPARVIGYGSAIAVVGTFLFNSIWSVTHTGNFDASAYGVGAGGVLAGIMAVGVGVSVKSNTEPKP